MIGFREYLKTSKNTKIYIAVAIIFSLYSAANATNFMLDLMLELVFFGLVAVGISFVEYKIQIKKK